MTQLYSITERDVRALANQQSFDRGHNYYRHDAVFDVVQRGNMITAKVEGSGYDPYRITVSVTESGIAETDCSCPYDWGGICKHIVAVLLTIAKDKEKIEEKPETATLLADLTADQLRQIILGITTEHPELIKVVEREVTWLQTKPASQSAQTQTVFVDINAVRREISKDFRLGGQGDPYAAGYYDEYAALEMYPDDIFAPHISKVVELLDANDVKTAESLITAIFESYCDGMTELDEWIYEYNEDIFYEANVTLGIALAEVLLSQDLSAKQQEEWLEQIGEWEEVIGDLDAAETAVSHGWIYPPLVAAMQGNITNKGAWEDESPFFADELALARLRILARQDRTEEYINLAQAEGQTSLAVNMMAQTGKVDAAVTDAKAYLAYPREALSLAETLLNKGDTTEALNVAEHGLSMEQASGRVELARWTRTQAQRHGNDALALQAAQTAFADSCEFEDYTAVQKLAGDSWESIKPSLLKKAQQHHSVSHKLDIYLHEKMLAEAMQAIDRTPYHPDYDLHRVLDATKATYPDWGIRKCQQKAVTIMDAGQAKYYETAVSWLSVARDIYQQHQRQSEWETYLDDLLDKHHRKYKLVPMLKNIRF